MAYLSFCISMKIKSIRIKNLLKSSIILSLPGFISIFLSLLSIPIHLKIAGLENYGNYLLFHIILSISLVLNLGISKSIVIGSNFEKKNINKIAYDAIKYSCYIIVILIFVYLPIKLFINQNIINDIFSIELLFIGLIISILYLTFEGILQALKYFKNISLINFVFYSLSLSLPSILLIFFNDLDLNELISLSIFIKIFTIVILSIYFFKKKLIIKNDKKIFFKYFKKNSPWLSLNSALVQIYDIFDKYLIKIFLGSGLMAIYSIPQQITGKLTILSKGFSAFLLPNLYNNKNDQFIYTLEIFLKFIPILIFLLFPAYPLILEFWLNEEYSYLIHDLTKIFSLVAVFSCSSHILVTKYESEQKSNINFKIEFIFLPIFFSLLIYLCSNGYSLITISSLVLVKEIIFNFLRLFFLNLKIKEVVIFYINLTIFPILLIISFVNMNLFYLLLAIIIFYTIYHVKFNN